MVCSVGENHRIAISFGLELNFDFLTICAHFTFHYDGFNPPVTHSELD